MKYILCTFLFATLPFHLSADTGFYAGVQLGALEANMQEGVHGGDDVLGHHVGYAAYSGNIMYGLEFDRDKMDASTPLPGGYIASIRRVKLRAGYDVFAWTLYGTAGIATAKTTQETGFDGKFFGIGLIYDLGKYSAGAEVLRHNFDDIDGAGRDFRMDTFTLRASYHF